MSPFLTKHAGDALRAAGALSTVGLAFVFALVIGFWSGTVLDGWLGTKPVFTLLFFLFGLIAGVLNVFRIVSHANPGRPAAAGAPAAPAAPRPPGQGGPEAGDGPEDQELVDDDDR
ncbi:MAG: AtpZ/AtpI family protein [Vicinamibacterales bacterium]